MKDLIFITRLVALFLVSHQVINPVGGRCIVNVTIKDGPVIQVHENEKVVSVTFIRTGNTSIEVEVNATTYFDTAKNGSDFNPSVVNVSFAQNVSLVTVNFTILNDFLLEDYTERFFINITTNDGNVCTPHNSVIIEIKDDEKVTIGFHREFRNFSENVGNISITFFKTNRDRTVITLTARYFTAGIGNATINTDYKNVSGLISFTTVQYTKDKPYALTIIDNNVVEDTKCFNVSLESTHPNVMLSRPLMICIINDDKVTIEFRYSNLSINEELGMVSVPVIKTGDATIPISVKMTMSEDYNTAIKNVDYVDPPDKIIRFDKGVKEMLFNVTIKNDGDFESTETFFIGIEALDLSTTIIGSKKMAVIRITDKVDNEIHLKKQRQIEEDQKRRTVLMTYLLFVIIAVLIVIILIFIIMVLVIIQRMKKYEKI